MVRITRLAVLLFGRLSSSTPEHIPDSQADEVADTTTPESEWTPYWNLPSLCTLSSATSEIDKFCLFTDTNFANGRGISVIAHPDHAAAMLNLPAFSQPRTYANLGINSFSNIPFQAQRIKGRGIGLIANRTIQKGEWLMSFTPAYLIDRRAEEIMPWHERLYFQRLAFDRLPAKLQEISYSLYGQGEGLATDALDDILMTNTFGYSLSLGNAEDEQEVNFRLLFPEIARFNHACRPSADCYFDPVTLAQHIYAAREIFIGEEISISYIPQLQTRAERQEALNASWGFSCTCETCASDLSAIEKSDARINRITEIRWILADKSPESTASPDLAEELIALMRTEKIWVMMESAYTAAAIEYNSVGDALNARKYAQLALEHGHVCTGPSHPDSGRADLIRLLAHPEMHETWKSRIHAVNNVSRVWKNTA